MENEDKKGRVPGICLSCEDIDKVYPGTKALDRVSFQVRTGKVNVLVGENGAGKSTLMKIIAGIESPSGGRILMDGEEVRFRDTTDARGKGIGIIHQELSLFPNLNVYQNIFMANEHVRKKIALDNREHVRLAEQVLKKLEYPIDPNTIVGDLRVGQQQMVEIARNLIQPGLKILIMDEPTSSLSSQEVEVLFRIIKELKASGISIVYISHRLEEVMQIGDYVTVLRDGRKVAEDEIRSVSVGWIVEKMIGSEKTYSKRQTEVDFSKRPVVLEVEDLCLPKRGGGMLLSHVGFRLRQGEILGIYGLLGAGRTELFECLMGLRPEHTGKFRLNGKEMRIGSISEQISRGFAMVPEDRQREGLVQTMSIGKNISLSSVKNYTRFGFLDARKEKNSVLEIIRDIHIKVSDASLPILSLSGGNQQKVVIGKGVLTRPDILLMDEPTRGIDVGAKAEVFGIIRQYAERGVSILVISSELKEIVALADRILVLSNGILTGEFQGDEIAEQGLVEASYLGHKRDAIA